MASGTLNPVAEFDQSSIGAALGGIVATLGSVWAGFRIVKGNVRADAVANADANGTIEAINTYKELVATLTKAKSDAEARADKFAAERNEALQGMYELKGQMRTLTDQLEHQTKELVLLRDEVSKLRGRRQDDQPIR